MTMSRQKRRTSLGRLRLRAASGVCTESLVRSFRSGRHFFWAGDEWLVPAAYICKEGIVLDIVKRVPVEKLSSFREKWSLSRENDGSDWEEAQRIRAQAENPFHEDIGARLTVNGRTLSQSHGYGFVLGCAVSGGERPGGQACAGALCSG